MAAVAGQEPETNDTLAHLEERIQKAVALVQRLRQEKDAAVKELAASRDEVASLQTERLHVRTRLEKLLGHIDQLGASIE